jgi:hypothetical protein
MCSGVVGCMYYVKRNMFVEDSVPVYLEQGNKLWSCRLKILYNLCIQEVYLRYTYKIRGDLKAFAS